MDDKYNVYRNIRYNRTYRTLGKMSWWRIVLGVILLIFVVLLSGLVSQMLAARGQFHMAEKLMISPAWMERYKPETKAFIEAGVLYQDGDYEAAEEAFENIEDFDAALTMLSLTRLNLASENLAAGERDEAYGLLTEVDFSQLSEEDGQVFLELCRSLCEQYSLAEDAESQGRAETLQNIMDSYSEN